MDYLLLSEESQNRGLKIYILFVKHAKTIIYVSIECSPVVLAEPSNGPRGGVGGFERRSVSNELCKHALTTTDYMLDAQPALNTQYTFLVVRKVHPNQLEISCLVFGEHMSSI